jgi:hypothetical protein
MSFFLSTKSENRSAEKVLPVGYGASGRKEEQVEKGYGRVNIVQALCTHVCKWKK